MSVTVIRGDCFKVLAKKRYRNAAALIIADPPYGGIVNEAWDVECYRRLGYMLHDRLMPGGTAYVWGGVGTYQNRPFFKWLSEVEEDSGTELRIHNFITWSKRRAYGKRDNYLFTREECVMLVKGEKPRVFNIPLLDKLRGYAGYNEKYPAKSPYLRRTNVWTDITELFKGKIHVAEKPDKLAEIMIRTSSNPGDLVIDPFAGSGSTGVAAKRVGKRECLLIEKSNCPMHKEVA